MSAPRKLAINETPTKRETNYLEESPPAERKIDEPPKIFSIPSSIGSIRFYFRSILLGFSPAFKFGGNVGDRADQWTAGEVQGAGSAEERAGGYAGRDQQDPQEAAVG